MKDTQIRKIICMIMLIMKDFIKLLMQCLIATILVSICIENGWILSNCDTDVSYAMFWKLFSDIFVFVPLIMFYRGITGRYKVEIKVYKVEITLRYAKLLGEEFIGEYRTEEKI